MNKKKFNFKGNRLLKNNPMEIKSGDFALNPLTLTLIENLSNNSQYFSRFYFQDKELINTTFNKDLQLNDNKFMATPPILIHSSEFLKVNDINNINNLIQYIDNNIDDLFDYNNRIVNCFIRSNFIDLSKNNKILSSIYLKLFKNNNLNRKEIDNFIKKWFKNNTNKSFSFNLGNDLKNFLSNKYES